MIAYSEGEYLPLLSKKKKGGSRAVLSPAANTETKSSALQPDPPLPGFVNLGKTGIVSVPEPQELTGAVYRFAPS